jgi:polyferredoxin
MERRTLTLQPAYDPRNPKRNEADKETHGFDLLSIPWLRRILLWKHTRTVLQVILLFGALAIIYDGFFGDQFAPKNFATTASWIDYRFILILSIFAVGNLFCMSCPFVLVSHNIQKRIGLNRNWPNWLKGKWIALGLLIVILFSYEQLSFWNSPFLTALVTVIYFAGAVGVDFVFKGNSFCKYVCPLGLFNQAYAMVSPTEVKSKSFQYCASCTTKECVRGRTDNHLNRQTAVLEDTKNPRVIEIKTKQEQGQIEQEGCQMALYMGTKQSNLDCTYQLSCARACPYSNVGFEFRNPLRELWTNIKKREMSLAVTALVLSFGALSNAGAMIGPFTEFETWLGNTTGLRDNFWSFTLVFLIAVFALPALFGWLTSLLTQKLARTDESLGAIFKRFGPALLPLGMGIWMAHYFFHFVVGAGGLIPAFQAIFVKLGVPIFGQPNFESGAILPYGVIFPLQLVMIYGGFMGSAIAIYQISRKMYKKKAARRAMIPFIALALLLAVVAILIMTQPMQARGALTSS